MLQRKPALKLVPKIDKEFAALIAPLTAEERQQLEANLIAHGCRDALVVWRGLLLDGHNRLEICNRHGIAYDTTEIELPDRESAKLWIEENQIGRRNLTTDQRAAVAYRLMQRRVAVSNKQRTAKARASRGSGISVVVHAVHNSTPRQRERTARELQISTRKLRDITALARTDPEIVNRIANGEISLRDARETMLEQVRQRNLKAVLKTHVSGQGIYTGDMRQLFQLLDDDSVSLFISEPPCDSREALSLYTELGKLAQQKLKPGGFCLVVCGQLNLDEIVKRLSEFLDWYWLCAARFDGPHARIWPRKVSSAFKPILIFTKRPAPKKAVNQWIADLVDQSNAGKGHQDGQAVGDPQYFIEQLTIPGELVVDPFAGHSSVPHICAKIGRPFIGTESNPGLAATARAMVAGTSKTINRSIENGIVREISIAEAKPVVVDYEWLGTMPAVVHHCFGIYFDGAIGGVAVYGAEYTENRGVWRPYGYEGKIICLARGACLPWAPKHSASKLIRTSMRMLPEKYKVITATVDNTANEVGTIYQACGFDYVGQMSKGGNRASILEPNGKHLSERQAYARYGTRSIKKLRELGLNVVSVPRKNRYFAFTGSKKEKRENRKAIAHLIKPYPKRPTKQVVGAARARTAAVKVKKG